MPISVVCPGCKARFTVGDKNAGKKGPCPKCKAVITIPELAEEVKIHAPEDFAAGGKDAKGRAVLKPIARKDAKLKPVAAAAVAAGTVIVFALAWVIGRVLIPPPSTLSYWILGLGALVVAPPVIIGGYTVLRDDELEPYRGTALLIRSTICAVAYAALWGIFEAVRFHLLGGNEGNSIDGWQWLYVAPPFFLAGAGAALACLDLDFGSGFFHYSFYVLVTVLLGWTMGVHLRPIEPPASMPAEPQAQAAAQ